MTIENGVTRLDIGGLSKPKRTDAGFLRADAYLTRAGIFQYRQADGTVRREFRSPEEVFKEDSMQSFVMAPVTDEHPPRNLTSENARDFQRGAVGETLRRDGDFMRGTLMITDADLITSMESGKKSQVSCGYVCDVEMTPGVWKGEKYDAVQTNIRGNHVAIVPVGRAGAAVRVRMDARDAGMVEDSKVPTEQPVSERLPTMKNVRIDGVSYEVNDQVAEVVAKLEAAKADALAGAEKLKLEYNTAHAKLEARCDGLVAELKTAKEDGAKAPEKIRQEIRARMNLEASAAKILGKSEKFDGKSDREVRVAVLTKLDSKFDFSAKGDEYVAARFDIAIESARKDSTVDLARARVTADDVDDRQDDDSTGNEVMDAADKNAEAMRNMWKEPIGRQVRASK